METAIDRSKPILVTGATGYVGGRLVPYLLDAGYRVRAAGRSLEKLNCRPWARHERVETVRADARDPHATAEAARGCSSAFYLIHSMVARQSAFAAADRRAAAVMAAAAAAAGLDRIIYLGGLGEASAAALSRHLKSRFEVEEILRAGPVPVTVLRAAMILGSGSASFEMLRYLVERLPVMTPPRWVGHPLPAHRHRRRAALSQRLPGTGPTPPARPLTSAAPMCSPTGTSSISTPTRPDFAAGSS